jgi:hypothetical protein
MVIAQSNPVLKGLFKKRGKEMCTFWKGIEWKTDNICSWKG